MTQVALVGLSQSGKSSLFSALTEGHVHGQGVLAGHADRAIVAVPDERLVPLSEIYRPKKTVQATVEFLDLPGLSFLDEAGRSEARRVLAQARQSDMLVLVIGGFASGSVATYREKVDPGRDLKELKEEMLLADLEQVENRIQKLKKAVTKPTKELEMHKRELGLMNRCQAALEESQPIAEVVTSPEEEKELRSFGFLTLKPTRVVLNVNETEMGKGSGISEAEAGGQVLVVSAEIEAELARMEEADRGEFLADMGLTEAVGERLIKACLAALDLVCFLTVGSAEVRAWPIRRGSSALEAAGLIHSDMQRGFIRAETIRYEDFRTGGDMKSAKAAGKVRLEGKGYLVQDGDIITFRFNV